ncbi:MAG TPA: hypothetical protein VHD36_10850 [Pirellulales bacterium]|nr:hypothetical protein [Pirellulales bacterium]
MASPFALFRKHERWMMAILGVMAMVAFVFLGPLLDFRGMRGSAQDPVVAETKLYGDIHESDLGRMLMARNLVNRFAQQTFAMLYGFSPPGYFGPETEAGVVDTMLMARKAEQIGMRVTDDEITRFLQTISENRLTGEQFSDILAGISGRRGGISRRQLYDALRTELMAQRFAAGFRSSQQVTPAERWEAYQKLNSRATIQAIPVAVADFIDKVAEPDNTAVQTLYENYKQFEPTPGAPVPGFKIPAKIVLQYFVASYEQFEDPAAVTQEEIVSEYEKNKDTRYLYSGELNSGNGAAGAGEPSAQEGAKPEGESSDATPPGEKSSDEKPADEKADGDQAATPPAEEKPADDKPSDKKPAADAPPQSSNRTGLDGTELALATFAQDEQPAAAPSEAAAEKPTEEKPAAEAAPAEKPAEGAATPAASEEKRAETPAAGENSDVKADAASTEPARPKYDPLEKVEPAIRSELARRKAMEKMSMVLNQLREQKLVKYGNERTRWEVKHEKDRTLQPPKPLDFDALAAENHLTTQTTKPLSAYELSQVEGIGESFVGERSLVQYAFGPLQLYQPVISGDAAGNLYLVWKTEQTEARVPELSEIKDEVVRAAKMIEARKPALERAQALAGTASKDKIPLAELATRDVLPLVKPEPFSWLTYGTTPNINNRMPPRLSTVQDVEDAGTDFMQAVFSQQPEGLTTAFNNPQTIVYAIQVTEFDPSLEVLRRTFLADDFRSYAQVIEPQRNDQLLGFNRSIEQEAGLRWVREPDARRGRGGEFGDEGGTGD